MSTYKRTGQIVALTLLGLAGWHNPGRAAQEEPVDTPSARPAAAVKTPKIVLLTDGRMVQGHLSEEDNLIVVTQPVGTMKFPKKRIEKVLDSIRDVYLYKVEQLPENDFDERLKLARWCLAQKLTLEARQELDAILKLSPKHQQAGAMLFSLDQAEARMAMHSRDPEVQQTSGADVKPPPGDRPGLLDSAVVQGARRGMGIPDLPVVFDLPPAQAVKRADEFARYVHPVLQTYCIRCHDDRHEGPFQLVAVKTKADRNIQTMRANLDATLKLVDRENPTRSELLSSALRPHGRGTNTRPIFQGSNDRGYQILSSWVNNLRTRKSPEVAVTAKGTAAAIDPAESFASDRARISHDSDSQALAPTPFTTGPVEVKSLPPVRYMPGKGMVAERGGDPNEFPIPFAVGGAGPRSSTIPQPARQKLPATDHAIAPASARGTSIPAPAASKPAPPLPNDLPELPGADEGPKVSAPKKTSSKPMKIDPSVLEKALRSRNQGRSE